MKKASIPTILGAVLAAVFPVLNAIGVDITHDQWGTVVEAIAIVAGVIIAALGESPAQTTIENIRAEHIQKERWRG